ncbi:MAG: hypothetical protein QOF76_5421, partial [Solirubrobacteraceae bacterium]|nr:hypothetical protein [Solirubrobacteraceae bacterium]
IDDVELESAHVVGLSMGALVALELAIRIPSRVKSLVLVGGGPGGPTTSVPHLASIAQTVGGLAGDLRGGTWPAAVLFSERFREEQPEQVAKYVKPFQIHRPPPWITQWQSVAASCFSRAGDLHRVRAPTLVVHGDQDAMSPLSNGDALARGIPGAELHIARGCGHAVILEQPEAAADLIIGWADRHADVRPAAAGRWDHVAERATRPFALHAGTLRSTLHIAPALWKRLLT